MNYLAIYQRRQQQFAWIERHYPAFASLSLEQQRRILRESKAHAPAMGKDE